MTKHNHYHKLVCDYHRFNRDGFLAMSGVGDFLELKCWHISMDGVNLAVVTQHHKTNHGDL